MGTKRSQPAHARVQKEVRTGLRAGAGSGARVAIAGNSAE
jgi:hypothetical protein